jgi:NAD(P)-dependent dehydrogenase (short-subunit alcohol dehydrogenase family)
MYESLVDKRVVVTAAADGIGRAMAEAFLAAGAQVHVCDLEAAPLDAFREAAPALGTTVADVTAPEQVARLFAEAEERFGGLDVLVNNAGIAGPAGPVEDCSLGDWRRTLAVGLDGAFHCLRHAVPLLKAAGAGSIINISSTAGLMGYPLRAPYTAAKWALVGLSKSLAVELGPFGIRVNAICPGSVDGPRMERVIAAEAEARGHAVEDIRERYLTNVSLRTFIEARDIAEMALFLASDAGAKISGQALAVDGHTESLAN